MRNVRRCALRWCSVDCIVYEWRQLSVVRRAHTVQTKIRTRKQITDEHGPYLSRICLQPLLHVTPTHRFCSSCKWKRENSKDRQNQKTVMFFSVGRMRLENPYKIIQLFDYESHTIRKLSSLQIF